MTAIKQLISLAFVPIEDVIFGYEQLVATPYFVQNDHVLKNFLDYFNIMKDYFA